MGSYKHPDCGHVFEKVYNPRKKRDRWSALYRCKFCRDSKTIYRDDSSLFPEEIYSNKAKSGQEGGGEIVRYYTPGSHSDYKKNSWFSPF